MTDAPESQVRVRSTTDLVEVVPTLLGFHPEESLVLIAIDGARVVLTARVDLPRPGGPSVEAGVAAVWRRFPQAALAVIAFSADQGLAWCALESLDRSLPEGTERLLVHADGGRWYLEPEAAGVPYDATGSVHLARAAFEGRPVRRSRAELRALVKPAFSPPDVTAALDRVAARSAGLADLSRAGMALLDAHDADPGELDLDDATLLCLASHDPTFLDAAMLATTRENARARQALWLQVVRGSVPNCAGYALAALALAAWVCGDGALQVVCLEASAGRPGPQDWFDFLDAVNAEAVEPGQWDALREAFLADRAAHPVGGRSANREH